MKRSSHQSARWLFAVLVFGVTNTVGAADASPSHTDGAIRKLGRGLANVLTCPLELLRTPTLAARDHGTIAGATVGLVQGIWNLLRRGGAGVFEIATFYADNPKGLEPPVKPEFVWADGSWSE